MVVFLILPITYKLLLKIHVSLLTCYTYNKEHTIISTYYNSMPLASNFVVFKIHPTLFTARPCPQVYSKGCCIKSLHFGFQICHCQVFGNVQVLSRFHVLVIRTALYTRYIEVSFCVLLRIGFGGVEAASISPNLTELILEI